MSNYVMIVVPYCLLGPFVFRKVIFKERSPFEESPKSIEIHQAHLKSAGSDAEREELERNFQDEVQRQGLDRSRDLNTMTRNAEERSAEVNAGNNKLKRNLTAHLTRGVENVFLRPSVALRNYDQRTNYINCGKYIDYRLDCRSRTIPACARSSRGRSETQTAQNLIATWILSGRN